MKTPLAKPVKYRSGAPTDSSQNTPQYLNRGGRTAGYDDIDWDHAGHSPATRIACAENAAVLAAIADSNDQLGIGRGIKSSLECTSMCRETGPVTSSMSAWRGLATKWMPIPSML